MSEFKLLKEKIEAEMKSKTPSANKIINEVQKVYDEKIKEIERLTVRCRNLEKTVKKSKMAPTTQMGPKFKREADGPR